MLALQFLLILSRCFLPTLAIPEPDRDNDEEVSTGSLRFSEAELDDDGKNEGRVERSNKGNRRMASRRFDLGVCLP